MNGGVVAFQLNDGDQVFIEAAAMPSSGTTRGLEPTEIVHRVAATFEEVVDKIRAPVNALIKTFEQAASGVDEVELNFGLGFRADAGAIISKVGGETNIAVTIRWKRDTARSKLPPPSSGTGERG
jgi:hypothetical protein